jgi:molecular chaperone GrpE
VTARSRKTLPEDREQEVAAAQAPERAEPEAPVAVGGEGPSDTSSPGPSRLEELEARLAAAEAQRDEYLADLKRLAAEYENYRKRAAREQERLVAHAHERLVRELLPVLDDLERALEAAERHEEAALIEGVRLVERALRTVLEREGLVEIEADGAFDPHVHEALLAERREGAEPGSVAEVVQRGYRLGGKVIRPARVIVAE